MKKELNAKQGGFYRPGREADVQSNQRAPNLVEDRDRVSATNHVINLLNLLYAHIRVELHHFSPSPPNGRDMSSSSFK